MNELEIAEAIRDGRLPSPQRYGEWWLFDMRVTGTGTAYRPKHDEYVYRDPDDYLNEEFLRRCSGLPVIFEHPEKGTLDSKEYARRSIGSVFLPYVKGDEVWAVCKIIDAGAVELILGQQLSTSPAVVFRDPSVNTKIDLGGDKLLVEGKPSLLDHLAVCVAGVWDKSGPPSGIATTVEEEETMTEPKKAEGEGRDDAAARLDEKLDKFLAACDALAKRVDAVEEREKARETAADKRGKRADGEGEPAGSAGKDLPRSDSIVDPADEAAAVEAQARFDSVCRAWGEQAFPVLAGENARGYARRALNSLLGGKKVIDWSPRFSKVDVLAVADSAALSGIVEAIYADAEAASRTAGGIGGALREVKRKDSTGRQITEFLGRPSAWMQQFSGYRRRLHAINTGAGRRA